MNRFIRRLIKLEPPDAERPLRIIWNDGSGTAQAEADALEAKGFKVMIVGWLGVIDEE